MRLQDIAIVTNTPLDTDRVLLEKFKAHDRIAWDPKTDLYSYKVDLLSFRLIIGSHDLSRYLSMNSTSVTKPLYSPRSSGKLAKAAAFLSEH